MHINHKYTSVLEAHVWAAEDCMRHVRDWNFYTEEQTRFLGGRGGVQASEPPTWEVYPDNENVVL
jgi:hypothetical protein